MRVSSLPWLLLTSLLAAQERRPLVGRVVDGAGAPLAGFAVTVAWSAADHPELGAATSVAGESDARGYFKIPAPTGQRLWVWAIGKPEADGSYAASRPNECFVGEPRLEVVAERQGRLRPLRFEGLTAWGQFAPFSVRIRPFAPLDLVVDLPLDDAGACAPPPTPRAGTWVELLDARGIARFVGQTDGTLTLPPAQSLPIEVVDDAGKPVADAEILHLVGEIQDWSGLSMSVRCERWLTVGKTDAQGKATAVIAWPVDPLQAEKPGELRLLARKPGHAPSHAGFGEKWFLDGVQLGDGEKPKAIKFTLAKAEPFAGVLTLPGKRPEALLVQWTSKIAFQNGWTHLPRSERVVVAADGAFSVTLPTDAYEIGVRCSPVLIGGDDGKSRMLPVVLPPIASARGRSDIGSATLAPTRFQITAPDAAPLSAVKVFVCNQVDGNLQMDPPAATLRVGAAGTGEILVASPEAWLLAVGEQGYAFVKLADAALTKAELRLEPFPCLRGQVVDEAGKPVPGAQISVHRTSMRGGARGADWMARQAIGSIARSQMDTVTDADGKFVMRFLPQPGLSMQARASVDGKASDSFSVEEGDSLTVVVK